VSVLCFLTECARAGEERVQIQCMCKSGGRNEKMWDGGGEDT